MVLRQQEFYEVGGIWGCQAKELGLDPDDGFLTFWYVMDHFLSLVKPVYQNNFCVFKNTQFKNMLNFS